MSEEKISEMAKLHARRLVEGVGISDSEMRLVLAGLLLAVDKLTGAIQDVQESLWTEDMLRAMMSETVTKHCRAEQTRCSLPALQRAMLGRLIRSVLP